MMIGSHELIEQGFGILGIAVIGYVGNSVLIAVGQKHWAVVWDIALLIAASLVGLKFVKKGIDEVAVMFHIF